jgi:hypothetical protein
MHSILRKASAAVAALILTLPILSCNGSDAVTSPSPSMPANVDVAGNWTGSIESNAGSCSGSPVMATFEQHGSEVSGLVAADACGIRGGFFGTLSGNTLSGSVEMSGCKGGRVIGTASGSRLTLSIGDFWQPATSGDDVVLPGGEVSLRR